MTINYPHHFLICIRHTHVHKHTSTGIFTAFVVLLFLPFVFVYALNFDCRTLHTYILHRIACIFATKFAQRMEMDAVASGVRLCEASACIRLHITRRNFYYIYEATSKHHSRVQFAMRNERANEWNVFALHDSAYSVRVLYAFDAILAFQRCFFLIEETFTLKISISISISIFVLFCFVCSQFEFNTKKTAILRTCTTCDVWLIFSIELKHRCPNNSHCRRMMNVGMSEWID